MNLLNRIRKVLSRKARRLHKDERGLEGIEYLLIAALVIIASIAAWKFLGTTIQKNVRDEAKTIDSTVQDSIKTGLKAEE